MTARCHVCGVFVESAAQHQHLVDKHPAPSEGFLFHFDAVPFRTNKPSMMVSELLALVGTLNVTYALYEKRPGDDVFHPQGVAVDLTHDPWFYLVPPATF